MLTIYKKVEKNSDNPAGIVEINSLEELDKPFLLCLSAQNDFDKSIYGIIREGAQAARVHTTQESAARFKIDDFPVDFLGLRFRASSPNQENYEEITDSFLYPLLVGDGKQTVEEMKKKARRINLMTYCDGTWTYGQIEKRLVEKLSNDGLSPTDIKEILSQISLVAIGTMVNTGDFNATTVTFVDLNDEEISTGNNEFYKDLLTKKGCKSIYGRLGKNSMLYLYDGSGAHRLKEYFIDDNIVKPAICGVLSHFLEKSVENENSDSLVEISVDDAKTQLEKYADESKSPSLLLQMLDESLSYGSAPKYTVGESKLRHELDLCYKKNLSMKSKVDSSERRIQHRIEQIDSVIDGIKKYSSETTFYQILVSAGLWQQPGNRDVFSEKSDKQIREMFEMINNADDKKDESSNSHKL